MSLRVDSVTVAIGDKPILRDVDLTMTDHEVVAVLGPSGSGKTTLLRVIAGLQEPTAGTVILDGVDITHAPVHQRGIGLMFQDHALFPHRNVAANVAFGLRMARIPRSEIGPRVEEVLGLVGLAGFGRRPIHGLSGGERQRVALARALAPRPRLLLLDEPLGSLDRALRERLVEELSELLRASGVSSIYVTHDQAEAFAMGDRLAVMRDGRVAQIDTPEQVWTAPADAGVAAIVGPVSLVPVEVGDDGILAPPWNEIAARSDRLLTPGPHDLVIRADTFSLEEAVSLEEADSLEAAAFLEEAGAGVEARLEGVVVSTTFRGDHHLLEIEMGGVHIRVAHRGPTVPSPGDLVHLCVVHPPAVVSRLPN